MERREMITPQEWLLLETVGSGVAEREECADDARERWTAHEGEIYRPLQS